MKVSPSKIISFSVVIILISGLLCYAMLTTNQSVERNNLLIIEEKLPLLEVSSNIKRELSEQERSLYEFFGSSEREQILPAFLESQSRIQNYLNELKHKNISIERIIEVEEIYENNKRLARQLNHNLSISSPDWPQEQKKLKQISKLNYLVLTIIESLTDDINQSIRHLQQQNKQKMSFIGWLVSALFIIIILTSVFNAYYLLKLTTLAAFNKRLSFFPEANPNPVANLDWQGEITYQNPSWKKTMSALKIKNSLPSDILDNVRSLQSSNQTSHTCLFSIKDATFNGSIFKNEQHKSFHLYLEDISSRKRIESELEFLAYHDTLTQLNNRLKLELDVETWIEEFPLHLMSMLIIGVDRFSQVTASHGFDVGDKIIVAIKERIEKVLASDFPVHLEFSLYRFTGAKFVIVLRTDKTNNLLSITEKIAHRLSSCMQNFIANSHGHFYLNLSLGASFYPEHAENYNTLLRNADAAYSMSRRQGGNKYLIYNTAMSESEKQWLNTEVDIHVALNNHEFYLVYQPKICVKTGEMRGIEALARWMHSTRGFISPIEFITVAEQSGLIIELGKFLLEQACHQTQEWVNAGMNDICCAVNISPIQFLHFDFIHHLDHALKTSGLDPKHLELEITEGVLMQEVEKTQKLLMDLHDIGVSLSIDDFGTGYSSLAYLKSFPIDKLKIDKSFIDHITDSNADRAIIQTIIDLAKNLGIKVIAEGVETEEQFEYLRSMACDQIQGYLFSKPITAEEIKEYTQKHPHLFA